jgi:hypothetical protein
MESSLIFLSAIVSMLGWAMAYGLVIRRNYVDKTYGIPLVALGVNLAWEFTFSFLVRPPNPDSLNWLWTGINVIWLGLDCVILIQMIKYGLRESWPSPAYFYGALVGAVVFGVAGVLAITVQFRDWEGRWASFADNLMMSILFIQMLYQRGIRGQSIYIALGKLIGTLAVGGGYLLSDPGMPLQWYLTLTSLFFDALYLTLLYRQIRAAELNPWTRF